MNAKVGIIALTVLLAWGIVGGCPPSDDTTPLDGNTPTDPGGDGTADNGGTDGTDGTTDGDSSSDGDGVDDGSSDDGGGTDDGSADDGGSGDDGSGDDGGGGGDGDDSGDDATQPVFTGTYKGQLTHVKRESIGGPLGLEKEWTKAFEFTFGEDGLPTAFTIPGYGQTGPDGIEFVAEVNQVGQFVTLTESTPDGYSATLTVTVALATYNETDARVVLSLEHHGKKGNLTEDGTGVTVIQYELDGENLVYYALTDYEVNLSGLVNTFWQVESDGTLTPD
jgi:hypothetical protein